MNNVYEKKFIKILIFEKTHHNNYINIINELHLNNYEVYISDNKELVQEYLYLFPFYLLIIEYELFLLYEHIFKHYYYLKIIIIMEKYMISNVKNIYNNINIIDYYFLPIDIKFFIAKINFFLQVNKNTNKYIKDLHQFIWNTKLVYENKLHKLINNNDYSQYNIQKISQYILYFSYILNLINNYFLFKQDIFFEELLNNIINIIILQTCYFNANIKFNIQNSHIVKDINHNSINFCLFLFFITELFKNINTQIEFNINFIEQNNLVYVKLNFSDNLKNIIDNYNNMQIESESLNDFIKEYLWKNWQRKINLENINNNIIDLEFLLINKKNNI